MRHHKSSTLDLMRVTTSDKLEHMHPNVRCKKCGKKQWMREEVPLTWTCFGCGNQVYLELGRPVQQIEVVLRSPRGHEYEKTDRGTVVPRTEKWEDGLCSDQTRT